MNIIKIGGSSINSTDDLISNIVFLKKSYKTDDNFLIIISAFSRLTNILKEVTLNISNHPHLFKSEFEKINSFLMYFINKNNKIMLHKHINKLEKLFLGVSLLQDYSAKLLDNILTYGDFLSSLIFYYEMKAHFPKLNFYDTRKLIITDSNFGKANVNFDLTIKNLEKLKNNQTIIAGFIGSDLDNSPTTLGIENSNLTAILAAIALNAKKCIFITSTSGIYEIDPNLIPSNLIKNINYNDALTLSKLGLKLFTPEQIELSIKFNIELIYFSIKDIKVKTILNSKKSSFDFIIILKENIIIINTLKLQTIKLKLINLNKLNNNDLVNINIDNTNSKIIISFRNDVENNELSILYEILKNHI
jgi:aspartokinase/homoserine dehydrogenase 1